MPTRLDDLVRLRKLLDEAALLLSGEHQEGNFDESMLFEKEGEVLAHDEVIGRIQVQVEEIITEYLENNPKDVSPAQGVDSEHA
jgi:hypothetical protein